MNQTQMKQPDFQYSSVEPDEYYSDQCSLCPNKITEDKDGRCWVGGKRVCLKCASSGYSKRKGISPPAY